MSYIGIYTNDLSDTELKEYKKSNTIEELEDEKTNKRFLKIYELQNDYLEEAELIATKILR